MLAHPYFDVTGPDGSFEIAELPAGTYEVEIRHESLGAKPVSVTVTGEQTRSLEFTLRSSKRR